jgi:hypothetical protein
MKPMSAYWRFLQPEVSQLFDREDGPAFWESALDCILCDAESVLAANAIHQPIVVHLGRCSEAIRFHTAIGRVRQSFGSGSQSGCSFSSLPAFDWSFRWLWQPLENRWSIVSGQSNRHALLYRIALPAQTSVQYQANVHTIWLPGSPENPNEKLTRFYGFEKNESDWNCVDTWEQADSPRRKFCVA